MNTYQVTLQKGRTDTVSVRADSLLDVKSIYEVLSDAKITNIKKVVYFNPSPSSSNNTNYYRELKILLSNGKRNKLVTIRFLKRFINKPRLMNLIKTYLTLDDKKVDKVQSLVIWQ